MVTRSVDPKTLKVGDDITFMVSESTSVTHRIVGVSRDAQGNPLFATQGAANARPDSAPVAAANVVGRVVYVNPHLGSAVLFVQENWPLGLFLAAVACGLSRVLTRIFAGGEREEEGEGAGSSAPAPALALDPT